MFLICLLSLICQLKLSEIMYNPAGSESDNEFIEIYNSGNQAINLSGFSVSDSKGVDKILLVSGSDLLQPGQYAVILDATYFVNSHQYDDLIPAGISLFKTADNTIGSGGLSNSSAETVLLLDALDQIVDSVTYVANYSNGYSFERRFEFGTGWGQSLSENGSPGFKNTIDLYVEKISLSSVFDADSNQFKISFKNQGDEPRDETIWVNQSIHKYTSVGIFEPLVEQSEAFQIHLNPGDSLTKRLALLRPENGQLRIKIQISNNHYINLSDSLTQIYSENRFPLLINLLRLEKPQLIRFYNPSGFSFFLEKIDLMGSGSWKTIVIERQLNPGDSFMISKHDSVYDAIFNDEIPNLYTVNGYLAIRIDQSIDSITYHSDKIPFYHEERGLVPRQLTNYNSEIEWIANPYKDQFSNGSSGSLQIEISHNPFSPNGDGIDDQLGIKLNYDEFDLVKLSVYSLSGRLVRQLLNGEYAAIGEFEWDGRDESGRLQITGPYILLFSAKRKKSGEQFVKKIPVVLIR